MTEDGDYPGEASSSNRSASPCEPDLPAAHIVGRTAAPQPPVPPAGCTPAAQQAQPQVGG